MGKLASLEILIVEDNQSVRKVISNLLLKSGYHVEAVENGIAAIDKLQERYFDLVITDYKMEPMNGMELLHKIKGSWPGTEVIMMTAFGSIESSVEAIKGGAFDYITKPFENEALLALVNKLVEEKRRHRELRNLVSSIRKQSEFDTIIGESKVILHIMDLVRRAARTDSTILIYGESGTGKELIAKSIHELSPRNDNAFMAINCGAIPENLQESELFGHVRGSFTTAHADKKGLLEVADGGTIFLDEIAEMSASTQVKLLRFLEDNELRRVGENITRKVDVRLIAATNKNLDEEIEKGSFRSDLYYRINVIPLRTPPLRQRKEDIPLLAEHFIQKYNPQPGGIKKISKRAMAMLTNYDWPGNIRELENIIQRAIALSTDTDEITPEFLPENLTERDSNNHSEQTNTLLQVEKEVILKTLRRMNGNKRKTAEELGISKATLWRKLKRFSSQDFSGIPNS